MGEDQKQFISQGKLDDLKQELSKLKRESIPKLADRIDEARQLGDLSENAEYHSAREDMAWARSRVKEIENILDNVEVISENITAGDNIVVGSTIIVKVNGVKKEYMIVGMQDAEPLAGKISNESPLGQAFLGKKAGDKVEVEVPAGRQIYEILEVK